MLSYPVSAIMVRQHKNPKPLCLFVTTLSSGQVYLKVCKPLDKPWPSSEQTELIYLFGAGFSSVLHISCKQHPFFFLGRVERGLSLSFSFPLVFQQEGTSHAKQFLGSQDLLSNVELGKH